MAGVVFVFVREDESEAETLAEAFDAAGFAIRDSLVGDETIAIVIWSRAALRSIAFRSTSESAIRAGRAVVVALTAAPLSMLDAPIIDLSEWDGEDGAALDPLFEAVEGVFHPAGTNVIALPSRPVYVDAEFTEPGSTETERDKRARLAWEAPIPAGMLRPAAEEMPPKRGAAAPRHDFRRVGERRRFPRAQAALAFAVVALIGGGVFAFNLRPASAPEAPAEPLRIEQMFAEQSGGAVSLASASAGAIGLEDVQGEQTPLLDPAPQAGSTGIEPPSARSIRRSPRRAARDQRVYQPPVLIPETILADLERTEPEPRS